MKFLNDEKALLWQKGERINDDPYGKAIYAFAKRWAELMEKVTEAEPDAELSDAAFDALVMDTSHEANDDHLTGFMVGAAAGMLAETWIHGERLRVAWNEQHGVKSPTGTVNPAVVTVEVTK